MRAFAPIADFKSRVQRHMAKGLSLSPTTFVADGAHLSGHVVMGNHASAWYSSVLRGDIEPVIVGDETNIQDAAVLHTADDLECRIGNRCTVGHSAIVHACQIMDECLIGMGAIILDETVIGPQCIIGAASLVTQRSKIPEGSLVLGSPAKVVRPLTRKERTNIRRFAARYKILAQQHLQARKGRD